MLFLNTGDKVCEASVKNTCSFCDAACLQAAGVPDGKYYVRDIWTRTSLMGGGKIVLGGVPLTAGDLQPVSGFSYLKLTPVLADEL